MVARGLAKSGSRHVETGRSSNVRLSLGRVFRVEKSQERRLAMNEALFRDVNERIREISDSFGQEETTYDFLCECSDPACAERVVLTRAEYEHVRSDSTRFVVAKGHALPEVESVIERAKDHVIVEKEGEAADVAVQLDTSRD